jgi:5-formyltetrahydrofolate cyclo-ligase
VIAKLSLRRSMQLKLKLNQLSQSQYFRSRMQENLKFVVDRFPGSWGSYQPLGAEPAPPTQEQLSHQMLSYPKVEDEGLVFCQTRSFHKSPFGFLEPQEPAQRVDIQKLAGVIVPGLVFDRQGHRLGRGKGYYDKTLKNFNGIKVGYCFAVQLSQQQLKTEPHDVQMDYVVTEQFVICCRGYKKWNWF